MSLGAVGSLGAQSAERSVALQGPGTLSTACVRDKEKGLGSSCHLQAMGVGRRRQRALNLQLQLEYST